MDNILLIDASNEKQALRCLFKDVIERGYKRTSFLEYENVFVAIAYDEEAWQSFCSFEQTYRAIAGEIAGKSLAKAEVAFTKKKIVLQNQVTVHALIILCRQ